MSNYILSYKKPLDGGFRAIAIESEDEVAVRAHVRDMFGSFITILQKPLTGALYYSMLQWNSKFDLVRVIKI